MASDDQIKQRVVALTKQQIELNKALIEQEGSIYQQASGIRAEMQNQLSSAASLLQSYQSINEAEAEGNEAIRVKEASLRNIEERLRSMTDVQDIIGDSFESIADRVDDLTTTVGQSSAALADLQNTIKSVEAQAERSFTAISSAMGLAAPRSTFLTGLRGAFDEATAAGIDFTEVLKAKFGQVFGGSITATFERMSLQMTKAFEVNLASMNKLTGAAGRYDAIFGKVFYTTGQFGASLEEVRQAFVTLNNQFTMFSTLGTTVQQALARTGAELQAAGLGADTYAKSISTLTAAIGQTPDKARSMARELSAFAIKLGQTPERLITDFNQAASAIAQFGARGVGVFKEMAQTAKALQIEMSSITGLASRLDTYSGALGAAGRMNAVFGTNIDGVNLMLADQNEKVEVVLGGLARAGVSFSDLNRQQRMLMANNLGLSVAETAKLLQYDTVAALRAAKTATQEYMSDQAALSGAVDANQSLQARWNALLERFSIAMTPITRGLSNFVGMLIELNDRTGGWGLKLLGVVGSLGALTLAMKSFKFVFAPLAGLFKTTGFAAGASAAGFGAAGGTAGMSAKGFLKLSAAVAGVGVGIGALTAGIGYFIKAWRGDESADKAARTMNALRGVKAMTQDLTALAGPLDNIDMKIDSIARKAGRMGQIYRMSVDAASVSAPTAPSPAATAAASINTQQIGQEIGLAAGQAVNSVLQGWRVVIDNAVLARTIREKQR